MTRKSPEKGSFSKKKSGPKSPKAAKKVSFGKKPFVKKRDSANDKTKSFSKSKSADFRKKDKEKDSSSFDKKPPFAQKADFAPRKSKTFSENKRDVKKKESEKGSPFGAKKSFQKKKDFIPGKGKPYSGEKSDFRKKDGEKYSFDKTPSFSRKRNSDEGKEKPFSEKRDFRKKDGEKSSFDKTPSFSRKRNSDEGKEKPFSETKRDFRKKESDRPPFGKKTSSTTHKDHGPGKGKTFSKNKPSEVRKKDFSKDPGKKIPAPTYDLKKPQGSKSTPSSSDELIRLNRYIANSGVCSRREADELIGLGEISVNGKVITELGYKVSRSDVVKYNNKLLTPEKFVYLLLNKPKDFITTTEDPQDRKTVMALVENACKERVYPVGRLDRNTTGLLLLTNDGELAKKLTHPSSNIKKLYQADLDKPLLREDFEKILNGLTLEDGPVRVDALAFVSPDKRSIGIEIHEGRNRIVRRIFEHLGYDVVKLDRVMYAGLTKKDLPRGNWKFLTEKEVVQLKHFL